MNDDPNGPLPREEQERRRATWNRMVDSNAEWVWVAVGRDDDLFLLVWLRLADRWDGDGSESGEALLRDVLAGANRGSYAGAAPPSAEPLSASGGR